MKPIVSPAPNFHEPPQELRDIMTAARAEVDRRVAMTKELLADDHFLDNDERTWALFDGLMNPSNLAELSIEDMACFLGWMTALVLVELAKRGS